jgi:hypothetical protein
MSGIRESLEENNNVIFNLNRVKDIDQFPGFSNFTVYCSAQKETNLSKLWVWEKFKNSALAGEFFEMQALYGDSDWIFTYAHDSGVYAVHSCDSYNGVGGIFVRSEHSKDGVAIETFKNYLVCEKPIALEY